MENEVNEVSMENEKVYRERKRKRMPYVLKVVFFILCIVGVFSLGMAVSENFKHKETVIQFGFKDVGLLVTQEWYGRIVEDSKKDRTFFNLFSIPGTESRQLFSIDVEVSAAIDFEKIEYNVDTNKKEIVILMPHANLYKSSEVKDSLNIYIDSESWFSRIDLENNQAARDKIILEAENTALDQGILTKADENAEKIITNMIKGNSICKDYNVLFQYID